MVLINGAAPVSSARIRQVSPDGSLEKRFAALTSELAVVFPGGLVTADHALHILAFIRRGGTALRRRGLTRGSRRQMLIFPPTTAKAEFEGRVVRASRRAKPRASDPAVN